MNTDLVFILTGVLGFVAVAGVGFALVGGDSDQTRAAKRAHNIVGAPTLEKIKRGGNSADAATNRRKQILENLKQTERAHRKARVNIAARLRQADLSFSASQFWIFSALFGLIIGGVCIFLHLPILAAIGLAFASGFGLPRWVLGVLITRRHKKFGAEFPGAIDVIVRGIKSGLPVNDCLKMIAKETPEPLRTEFQKVVEGLSVGSTLDQTLERMYDRVPTPEVRFLGIVMAIQQKTGGNLAEALGNLSTVLRARKLMVEKVKAMSGEAVASAFIIGSLPPGILGFVSFSSPKYIGPMFTDPRGHIMLLGGAMWMGAGIWVMRRMINFKQ
ncbi:MAG: type II secretion system F family protein [Caulobacteraceae bacterium]